MIEIDYDYEWDYMQEACDLKMMVLVQRLNRHPARFEEKVDMYQEMTYNILKSEFHLREESNARTYREL